MNGWRGRRMKVESAFCPKSATTPSPALSVAPLCLLTLVSKQLRRLNSRSLTYGVNWDPERQRLPGLSQLSVSAGAGLLFVLVTKHRLCRRHCGPPCFVPYFVVYPAYSGPTSKAISSCGFIPFCLNSWPPKCRVLPLCANMWGWFLDLLLKLMLNECH